MIKAITFEGIRGSGKSTIAGMLADHYENMHNIKLTLDDQILLLDPADDAIIRAERTAIFLDRAYPKNHYVVFDRSLGTDYVFSIKKNRQFNYQAFDKVAKLWVPFTLEFVLDCDEVEGVIRHSGNKGYEPDGTRELWLKWHSEISPFKNYLIKTSGRKINDVFAQVLEILEVNNVVLQMAQHDKLAESEKFGSSFIVW